MTDEKRLCNSMGLHMSLTMQAKQPSEEAKRIWRAAHAAYCMDPADIVAAARLIDEALEKVRATVPPSRYCTICHNYHFHRDPICPWCKIYQFADDKREKDARIAELEARNRQLLACIRVYEPEYADD